MIKWTDRIALAKSLHIWLILACFLALFFPSHILWTQCLVASVVWAVYLWLRNPRFEHVRALSLSIICFYVLIGTSGIWAEDASIFLSSMRMKIILLGIPFCFLVWSRWTERQVHLFTLVFISALVVSAIYVLFNYSINRSEILEAMLRGQPIPVPFNDHIRYALLLCFGFMLCIHQMDRMRRLEATKNFWLWFITSLALFSYIQFLAVKTGMLVSILIVFCFIAYKILSKRLYWKGAMVFVACLGAVYVMTTYVPTVKNKLSYFTWDLGKYKDKDFKNYSDGERIESIVKGYEIAKDHFWLGVGEGNLILHLNTESKKLPHNEFIVVWAQNGIFGLIAFVAIFIISLVVSFKNENWMAFAYTLSMLVANMLEPMLETQLGLTIFLLPLLIVHSIDLKEKN